MAANKMNASMLLVMDALHGNLTKLAAELESQVLIIATDQQKLEQIIKDTARVFGGNNEIEQGVEDIMKRIVELSIVNKGSITKSS